MKSLLACVLVLFLGGVAMADPLAMIVGKVISKTEKGLIVSADGAIRRVAGEDLQLENGRAHWDESSESWVPARVQGFAFVFGHPRFAELVDGDPVLVLVRRAGQFRYTTQAGAEATVAAYQVSAN